VHKALQHAVVVLRPEVDELPQRLLVEVSAKGFKFFCLGVKRGKFNWPVEAEAYSI
jgi:hypothetical protein